MQGYGRGRSAIFYCLLAPNLVTIASIKPTSQSYAIYLPGDIIRALCRKGVRSLWALKQLSSPSSIRSFRCVRLPYGRNRSQKKRHQRRRRGRASAADGSVCMFDRWPATHSDKRQPGRAASLQELHYRRWSGAGPNQPHCARLARIPLVLHPRRTVTL